MPAPGTEKYFIAIVPPSPIREQAMAWKLFFRDHYQTKAALNSPPHITLHMPFEWRAKKENELITPLTEFASAQHPFDLQLNGFGAFAPRVLYIDVEKSEPLRVLQQNLRDFCKQQLNLFNTTYRDLPFHPHLTVAFRDLKKSRFEAAWAEVKEKSFDCFFSVNGLVVLKHNGKIWEELRTIPFAAI